MITTTMYDFFMSSYSIFFFFHPYNEKGIVCCLQYQAKAISNNMDAYQEEMIKS